MMKLTLLLAALALPADEGPALAPPYHDFIVIPLRIHVLKSDDIPEVECALTDGDVRRVVGKANAVWAKAGIHWGVESVVREPAARQRRFRMTRDLNDGVAPLGLYRTLIPEDTHEGFDGLHVYFVHKMPVNGVYMGSDFAFVQETAALQEVEGGIDEPLPRVTAHELAHALGLPHRQAGTNLLASGTTGTSLNADEIARAREKALTWKGAARVADVRKAAEGAETKGDVARARLLWGWLADVPGDGAAEAARRRDAPAPKE